MANNPHVPVLLCDQMQACRLGAADEVAHTPFLDDLAGEGTHFTHMISAHDQCVTSRASFMTGLYPHECGVMVNYGFHGHQNRLSSRQRTLGHVFTDAGYETAYFGKYHFGQLLAGLGFEHAYDYDERTVTTSKRRNWESITYRTPCARITWLPPMPLHSCNHTNRVTALCSSFSPPICRTL